MAATSCQPPAHNHTCYYNRKGWYSVVTVDHNLLFASVYTGWPGSVHDARVLANSSICSECNQGILLQGDPLLTANHTIPIFLVGDSAYPLLRWLIKPLPESPILTNRHQLQHMLWMRCCRNGIWSLKGKLEASL